MNRHRAAFAEPLENRRLLNAPELINGTLTLTGTAGNDVAVITHNAGAQTIDVVFNAYRVAFPVASVLGIAATLGDGNDSLDAVGVNLKVWCDAGGGNDTLLGGGGNDCLIGGLDYDSLEGGLGDDSLSGSGGKDRLNGGPGRDRCDGGKSNDIVRGGSSNDRLIGGEGSDELYGDGGDDLIYAEGVYTDWLYGGSGSDRCYADYNDELASIETIVNKPA